MSSTTFFEKEYGSVVDEGCFSSIGKYLISMSVVLQAQPIALIELACTMRPTPSASAASNTLNVPAVLMRYISLAGIIVGLGIAARCTIAWQPRTCSRSFG